METNNILQGEQLITLNEASEDFGGVKVPMPTLTRWVQTGFRGLKLETVNINRLYTSREAIQRFIHRKQHIGEIPVKPKPKSLTRNEVQEGLRKYGIIK